MSEGLNIQQITQLRMELEEILRLLRETEPKTRQTNESLQQQVSLVTAALSLTRRLTGDENVNRAVQKIQRLISSLIMLRAAALSATAAMGPWGVLLASITAISTTLVAADSLATLADVH